MRRSRFQIFSLPITQISSARITHSWYNRLRFTFLYKQRVLIKNEFITFTLNETFCQHNMKIVRLKKKYKEGPQNAKEAPCSIGRKEYVCIVDI